MDSEKDIITIALMQKMIPNQGDAWDCMLKEFLRIFKAFNDKNINVNNVPKTEQFLKLGIKDMPPVLIDWVGLDYLMKIQKLAQRTAEMHIALGSEFEEMAFAPAHYNGDYEVWLKNRLLYQFQNRLNTVENNLHKLDGMALELAQEFLDKKNSIRKRFVNFDWTKLKGQRIRVHGDYHLGQILVKDNDFYILDFEGEPESTIRDRKVKQPPLKDVAGLFRSFHYAIYTTVFNQYKDNAHEFFEAAEILYDYTIGIFLGTYISKVRDANLNIGYNQERVFLLKYALLEKAVYELGYELNSRPKWALIPLKGISNIINN
jgi:maltose alpha-D-glucosyltransferase/alpha-amylase